MTLATRGLGATNLLCTAGLGSYSTSIIRESGGSGYVGEKYDVLPRRIFLKTKPGEPALRLKDIQPKKIKQILESVTEMTIEGETYFVTSGPEPTPAAAMKMLPPTQLFEKISLAQKELGVTKALARKALKVRAGKEIQAGIELKMQLVREDEELALIIIMSEV